MRSACLVSLCVALWVLAPGTVTADLGPKTTRDTGIWNDPTRFRLAVNEVEIALGPTAADITACFHFYSVVPVEYWDRGQLAFAWPLPPAYALPTGFRVLSHAYPCHEENVERDLAEFDCDVRSSPENLMRVDLEVFEQLGISRWYVFHDEFLMYMPGLLAVDTVVRYTQPYRQTAEGLGELLYVLRTGGLWAGPIERLTVRVKTQPGVKVAQWNWPLETGEGAWTNIEPEKDLIITVRQAMAGGPSLPGEEGR